MTRAVPAAIAALLLLSGPLLAQDAREVLIRSLQRERSASYAGLQKTVVTDGGRTRQTEQVVKRRKGKLRIEYLAPSRLKGELVVDDGNQFRHYVPALRVMEEGPSRASRAMHRRAEQIKHLREGRTQVTLRGEETLLGRKVDVVAVQPSKPERPFRTLWLDRETGVPLRVEEKRPSGRVSVTTFEQIDFKSIMGDAEFRLMVPQGATVVPASMGRPISPRRAEHLAQRLWGGLPALTPPSGYELTSAHQLSFRGRPVVGLRYTRGKEALTLFVSEGSGERFSAPVQPRLNVVQRPIDRMLVTLVGSLPAGELQQLLGSVRLSTASR
jgi:outer membrane lipoprotein-sorting protein